MINSTYLKAYVEVLEIISHFPKEEYEKIPKEKIKFYEANKDKDYQFSINPKIDLDKQNISKTAGAVIINLYKDYFATEEQKVKIQEILKINQQKSEMEKRKIYNPNDLFKDIKYENIENNNIESNTNTAVVQYKENFFTKFKNFIFNLLHKKQ